jgi:diaminopimelate epimerase
LLARRFCDRRRGIGGDGLLHLEPGERANARVRYLNADGSDADMCGNGARCAALQAFRLGLGGHQLTLDFGTRVVAAELDGNAVRVALGTPPVPATPLRVLLNGESVDLHRVDTGVPHAVVVVDAIAEAPLESVGPAIRRNPAFGPAGTNVDFVERHPSGPVPMRTYERGVEGETLACGTGAAAVALVATAGWGRSSPVDIVTRGGDLLRVHVIGDARRPENVVLEGDAHVVFTGEIDI